MTTKLRGQITESMHALYENFEKEKQYRARRAWFHGVLWALGYVDDYTYDTIVSEVIRVRPEHAEELHTHGHVRRRQPRTNPISMLAAAPHVLSDEDVKRIINTTMLTSFDPHRLVRSIESALLLEYLKQPS